MSRDNASNGFCDHILGLGATEIIPRELSAKSSIPNQQAHQSSDVIRERNLPFEIIDILIIATCFICYAHT